MKFKLRGLGEDSPVVFIRDAKTTAEAIDIGKHKNSMHMHICKTPQPCMVCQNTIYLYM